MLNKRLSKVNLNEMTQEDYDNMINQIQKYCDSHNIPYTEECYDYVITNLLSGTLKLYNRSNPTVKTVINYICYKYRYNKKKLKNEYIEIVDSNLVEEHLSKDSYSNIEYALYSEDFCKHLIERNSKVEMRDLMFLYLKDYLDITFEELGNFCGITREGFRQRYNRSLRVVRGSILGKNLCEELEAITALQPEDSIYSEEYFSKALINRLSDLGIMDWQRYCGDILTSSL